MLTTFENKLLVNEKKISAGDVYRKSLEGSPNTQRKSARIFETPSEEGSLYGIN